MGKSQNYLVIEGTDPMWVFHFISTNFAHWILLTFTPPKRPGMFKTCSRPKPRKACQKLSDPMVVFTLPQQVSDMITFRNPKPCVDESNLKHAWKSMKPPIKLDLPTFTTYLDSRQWFQILTPKKWCFNHWWDKQFQFQHDINIFKHSESGKHKASST